MQMERNTVQTGAGGVLGVSFLRARGGELEKQPLLTGGAAHGYWVAGDR